MADTKLVGSAGEHWVCSVLATQGWAVALTRDGLAHSDILAVQSQPPRLMIEVQVKTASHGTRSWRVNRKAQERALSCREWFVFVLLGERSWDAPRGFVVPRDHVAAAAYIAWKNWRTDPDVSEEKLKKRNTPIDQARLGECDVLGYQDRWDLLSEPTSQAPVLLPPHFRTLALEEDRVGLPEDHPWKSHPAEWWDTWA